MFALLQELLCSAVASPKPPPPEGPSDLNINKSHQRSIIATLKHSLSSSLHAFLQARKVAQNHM